MNTNPQRRQLLNLLPAGLGSAVLAACGGTGGGAGGGTTGSTTASSSASSSAASAASSSAASASSSTSLPAVPGNGPAPTKLSSALLPAWRNAMTAGTWATIPASNTIAAIDPAKNPAYNPNLPGSTSAPWSGSNHIAGVILPWCGACYDENTDTLWLPLGGGHGDYGGNEAYRIRLDQGTPTWSMPRPPSGSIPLGLINLRDGQEASGNYADGRPRSTHSYNKHVYVPGVGPIMTLQGSTFENGQYGTNRTMLLNESTGEWSTLATHPNPGDQHGGGAYDSLRQRIWWIPGASTYLTYYAFASGSWHTVTGSSYINDWNYTRPIYIAEHDVLVQLGKNITGKLGVWNLGTGKRTQPGTTNAVPPALGDVGAAGASWVPSLGALCVWHNSSDTTRIFTLSPSAAGSLATAPWTWGELAVTPANSVTPSACVAQGTYGRFGYSPRLDGFFLLNGVNQPVYFFALS